MSIMLPSNHTLMAGSPERNGPVIEGVSAGLELASLSVVSMVGLEVKRNECAEVYPFVLSAVVLFRSLLELLIYESTGAPVKKHRMPCNWDH